MILAIDTATRWTALGLFDGTAVVAEMGWFSLRHQTVELAPAVNNLLQKAGTGLAELKGIAVALGPGSYTGLRIGLGLAKGIALANSLPLVGVPTLDIVAYATPSLPRPLVAIAEAGRSRVWAGFYRWQSARAAGRGRQTTAGWQVSGQPIIEQWPALLQQAAAGSVFAGEINAGAARLIRASANDLQLVSPAAAVRRAGYLAEMGWQRLQQARPNDAAKLTPLYWRDPTGA